MIRVTLQQQPALGQGHQVIIRGYERITDNGKNSSLCFEENIYSGRNYRSMMRKIFIVVGIIAL